MLRDLLNNITAAKHVSAATYTADSNGTTVDLKQAGACVMEAVVGISGDTLSGTVYILLEMEHSDDGSSWSDCADADISPAAVTGLNTGTYAKIDDAAEDDVLVEAAYIGVKRYVRSVLNLVGTHTNGVPVAIVSIKGELQALPG